MCLILPISLKEACRIFALQCELQDRLLTHEACHHITDSESYLLLISTHGGVTSF